jgi:hypothetical protein
MRTVGQLLLLLLLLLQLLLLPVMDQGWRRLPCGAGCGLSSPLYCFRYGIIRVTEH